MEKQKFHVGCNVRSVYQGVKGKVVQVAHSVTFGQPTHLIRLTSPGRYGHSVGHEIWICETDLDFVSDTVRDFYRESLAYAMRLNAYMDAYGPEPYPSGHVSGVWIPDCLYESSPHHEVRRS